MYAMASTAYAQCCHFRLRDLPQQRSDRTIWDTLLLLLLPLDSHSRRCRRRCADADKFEDYLKNSLSVPAGHIRSLRDRKVTRPAIIQAFKDIKTDAAIAKDDPIIVFYCGHGSQKATPKG